MYHSPEMLLKKGYDTRVDIWAIGVLIFELLVGRPPFGNNGQHSFKIILSMEELTDQIQ